MAKMKYNQIIAFTFNVKEKNPFITDRDVWDYAYLTPAVKKQLGIVDDNQRNYVVVTCEPSKNGLYSWDANKMYDYKTWNNDGTICYYVPIEDCKFTPMEKVLEKYETNSFARFVIDEAKKQQNKWYKNDVKNRDYDYKRGKPEWMLK